MTTEDDFQNHLDADPEGHHTRLVFADWLDKRNDPRAAGYRELGRLRLYPSRNVGQPGGIGSAWRGQGVTFYEWWRSSLYTTQIPHAALPWFGALSGGWAYAIDSEVRSRDYLTRREAEDAAAIAYRL